MALLYVYVPVLSKRMADAELDSRVNFAIASNFIVLLFASSPTEADAQEALALLKRWRSILKIKSRSCDLLNLSLLRLDAMYVAGLDQLVELSPAAASAFKNQ